MEVNDLKVHSAFAQSSMPEMLTESLSFDCDRIPSSWVVFSTCLMDMALVKIEDWRGS